MSLVSVTNNIEYEWDVRNFEKSGHNVKSISFDKALIDRYNSLLTCFTKMWCK
ncbi:hypothetical protein [Pedobacter sp. P26]|uniref:hypothetical protein n=1 Tax=Pedobacter sp. P26 TaxID=3423956 RepID=UPI003D679379